MPTTIQIIQEATIAALLSMFLEFCFRKENIFSFWLEFWGNLYKFMFPYKIPSQEKMIDESDGSVLDAREYKIWRAWKITKPLGYCIVCFNFWVSLFYLNVNLLSYSVKEVILYFVLSSIIVRFFQDKVI